jgi:hypothetical protein
MKISTSVYRLIVLALSSLACSRTDRQAATDSIGSGAPPTVHATHRVAFQVVGTDTLSDSAQIRQLLPEQDGDGIVVLFTDPRRSVTAGLAIVDKRMPGPQLLWPDSVTSLWWTGPHMLAFTTTTGDGVRLVIDIHAAQLRVADTSATGISPRPPAPAPDSALIRRARSFIDSLHAQPGGAPQQSALEYTVTRVIPAPDGQIAAFHAAARDASGTVTNPSWFIIDRTTGGVASIDQITGKGGELPGEAGEWSSGTSFFYAKGRAIWEAEVTRSQSATAK